jgi:hypothetical protein
MRSIMRCYKRFLHLPTYSCYLGHTRNCFLLISGSQVRALVRPPIIPKNRDSGARRARRSPPAETFWRGGQTATSRSARTIRATIPARSTAGCPARPPPCSNLRSQDLAGTRERGTVVDVVTPIETDRGGGRDGVGPPCDLWVTRWFCRGGDSWTALRGRAWKRLSRARLRGMLVVPCAF